jgi:hypothetical protein
VFAAAVAIGACDAGKQADQQTKGPPIRIKEVSVGPNRTLPADGEIQIALDRYLLPQSITRQSVFVVTAGGEPADPALLTRYDPMSRTISVRGSKDVWLTPGQPYKLVFSLPPNDDVDDRGLRAIDRAALDPNQPLEIAFFASDATGEKNEKNVDFCGDVLPILSMKCVAGTCHASGGGAAAALILDNFTGVRETAIQRVANGANTNARAGQPDDPHRVFGVGMPLIDPDEPGNSWLLYKIELARLPGVDSGTSLSFVCNKVPDKDEVALPTVDPYRFVVKVDPPSDLERAILHDYVPGREMPFPSSPIVNQSSEQALSFDERQRLRLWIAQGAKMTECGGCTPAAFVPDASVEAGPAPIDGGADAAGDGSADASDAADQ